MKYPDFNVHINKQTIDKRIEELGAQLTEDYQDNHINILVLLKGGMVFASDLIRHIKTSLYVDCMTTSSYNGITSTGKICIEDLDITHLADKHVLIIDDILDTGLTLSSVKNKILAQVSPLSIKTCVLLNKQINQKREIEPDYAAFNIENEFVVGYGLDFNELFRNLPHISIWKQE